MAEEYYRFLARTITSVGQDPAQLRRIIYHYARMNLRKELWGRKDLQWAQKKQQMAALEKAIEQIEADIADRTMFFPTPSPSESTPQAEFSKSERTALVVREKVLEKAVEEIDPDVYDVPAVGTRFEPVWPFKPSFDPDVPAVVERFERLRPFKPVENAFWSTVRLVLAVILGVGLFVGIENRGNLHSLPLGHNEIASARPTVDGREGQTAMHLASASPPAPITVRALESNPRLILANMPVPTSYGVYAVSHGKLTDLQTLPIRVPDERVGISAVFSTPSESTLPDGHLQFIVFRRDLVNSAPDRVMVRVVARVMHALTFDKSGNANLVPVAASWAVRSNNYEMKVSPVNGNPEMIIIQPTNPNFVFPAGRYALLLQGAAYDFAVTGKITDTAQCLERTDAVDMPVYSECRTL